MEIKERVPDTISMDGALAVPVTDGTWAALRALRAGVRSLRAPGLCVTRLTAIAKDGRMVQAYDPTAHLLVASYRLEIAAETESVG